MNKFEKLLDQCLKLLTEHKLNKERAFIVILGKCNNALINKLEAQTDCKVVEASANVPRLLEMIKEIAYLTKGIHCEYWSLSYSSWKVIIIKQGKFESLTAYYNQFMDVVHVAESQWGISFPHKMASTTTGDVVVIATDEVERKKTQNKCLACAFIAGANQQKHGDCIAELNNSYLSGNNKCPKTPSIALELLNNYMSGSNDWSTITTNTKKGKDDDDEKMVEAAGFFQTGCILTAKEMNFSSYPEPSSNRTSRLDNIRDLDVKNEMRYNAYENSSWHLGYYPVNSTFTSRST